MRLAHIALVAVVIGLFGLSAQAENDEPLGVATVPAPQSRYAADWRKAQDSWTVERGILDRCRAERERCPSRPALQFLTVIDQAQLQTGRARIGYINRAINLAIRPMGNFNNYVVSEKWKAPLATLATPAIVLTMLLSPVAIASSLEIPKANQQFYDVRYEP